LFAEDAAGDLPNGHGPQVPLPKSLFRPEALRSAMTNFIMPECVEAMRPKLKIWAKKFAGKKLDDLKETELLPDFVTDIFVGVLGYTGPVSEAATYSIKREAFVKVDGKYADAGFDRFGGETERFVAVLEGKGPKDPLDRPFAGRRKSAVEQAMNYAVQLKIDWYIVTNMRETRLYYKGEDTLTFETFETASFATDEAELRRFVFLLGAGSVLNREGRNHFQELLEDSKSKGRELTNKFYKEYRTLRDSMFADLRKHNPGEDPLEVLAATQKILDRILFIAFAEDRDLLPRNSILKAYDFEDVDERPVWVSFQRLFRWVNAGSAKQNIAAYNGGLFKPDEVVDRLIVPAEVCAGFRDLAAYEYGRVADSEKGLIDVEILGHVFEQSIADIEELQNSITGRGAVPKLKEQKKSSRKEAGAFYTPDFITRHIVEQTLKPVLAARQSALQLKLQAKLKGNAKKALDSPTTFVKEDLTPAETSALVLFWEEWIEEVKSVRIVDPACGSGAFLIEAFNQLEAVYRQADGFLTELRGFTVFGVYQTILNNNLYGVDLNEEAVEIARLSCWIKTAEPGNALTSLDHNIRKGNSVVTDKRVHPDAFDWHAAFPEVFAAGGFDVVIGNPPYVRQEWIKEYKAHWEATFKSYSSTADLFVYFYELGIKLLRPNGRLGFITSGGWVRGAYGEGLRSFLSANAGLESMIDFGEFQPFEDAEMIRPTVLIASKREPGGPMKLWKWLTSGRPPEALTEVMEKAPSMSTEHLGGSTWELETDEVRALKDTLSRRGRKLSEIAPAMYTGIKTGLDSAFVVAKKLGDELINKDGRNSDVVKKFIQGTNIRPWHIESPTDSILFTRRGIDLTQYPLIQEHLERFRIHLEPRTIGGANDKESIPHATAGFVGRATTRHAG
jgi:type I restriction-modification system DNA methylase subunit